MIKEPLISIVIATYNAENTIERCLKSIIAQDYPYKEILVKDGLSNDSTNKITGLYKNHIAYFEISKDKGIYQAWNCALSHCNGDWICFLGADDYFIDSNIINSYAKYLMKVDPEKNPVVYGVNIVVNQAGELLYKVGQPWNDLKINFKNYMCLPHPGLMHHRSLFKNIGDFNPSYEIAGDYELLLRGLKYKEPAFWPKIICATPTGGISTIPLNYIKCLIEIRRAQKQNSINRISWYGFRQWTSALIRLGLYYTIGEDASHKLFNIVRKKRGLPIL